MLTARDVMRPQVMTVPPDLTVIDLEQKLLQAGISGVPVVDGEHLVGVVSRSDILRLLASAERRAEATLEYYHDVGGATPEPLDAARLASERIATARVRDIMSGSLLTVTPTAPVRDIARALADRRMHRILVTEDKRLAGVVTALDLVRAIADGRLA